MLCWLLLHALRLSNKLRDIPKSLSFVSVYRLGTTRCAVKFEQVVVEEDQASEKGDALTPDSPEQLVQALPSSSCLLRQFFALTTFFQS
jgi:hypothetical protein